jgi:hypothetical protein
MAGRSPNLRGWGWLWLYKGQLQRPAHPPHKAFAQHSAYLPSTPLCLLPIPPNLPACLPASRPAAPGLQYTFILHASKELPKAVTNVDKGKSKKRQEVGVRLPDDPGAEQAGQRSRGGAGEEGRVLDCLACLPMDGLWCGLVKVAVVVAASTSTVAPAGRQGQQR